MDNLTYGFSDTYGNDQDGHPNFKLFQLFYSPLYMTIYDVLKWIEFVHLKYEVENTPTCLLFQPYNNVEKPGPLGLIRFKNKQVTTHIHGGFAYSYGLSTYRNYINGMAIILMTNKNQGEFLQELNDSILAFF